MTYLRANKRPGDQFKKTVRIAVGGSIGILILIQIFIPHFFPAVITSIFSPFWRTEFSIQSGSLRSPSMILSENEDLKRQLTDAQVRLTTIHAIETENAELKAMLNRASSTTHILAAVLKRPPASRYDELIIDAGSEEGISSTSLVYASGNVLIGHVSDVLSHTSKVTLFSSPGQQYEVLIGASHAPATAIGQGGGQYKVQLSRDVKVSEGDMVIEPSLNDTAFGIVTDVESDPTQPFERVSFAPPVNVYQLRWVFVDQPSSVVVKKK